MLRRFEYDESFNTPSVVVNLITNISSGKGNNVYIYHVWSNNIYVCMRIRDMCFEIYFSRKLGHVEDTRYQITGQFFNQIMSNLNSL